MLQLIEKIAYFDKAACASLKATSDSMNDRSQADFQRAVEAANDAADRRLAAMEATHRAEVQSMLDKMNTFMEDESFCGPSSQHMRVDLP